MNVLGYIAVAALSSPLKTLIVDVLGADRKAILELLKEILESTKIIKIFHGGDNDWIRVKKDWRIFPRAVVDLQDLFVVWKVYDFANCSKSCEAAIIKHLKDRKPVDEQSILKIFIDMLNPGLDFLMEVFGITNDNKDKVATHADWRKRPIHEDLQNYVAKDSFYALYIFYKLMDMVRFNTHECSYYSEILD
jgi:ribonuclease D